MMAVTVPSKLSTQVNNQRNDNDYEYGQKDILVCPALFCDMYCYCLGDNLRIRLV